MVSVARESWFSDPRLAQAFALLNADGGEGRVVGGAVRNSLMGLPVADIDMATTLKPEEVMARAEKAGIRTIPTGLKHGTVTLLIDGMHFEVTTLRRDVETDGRHAEVAFTDDWAEDAARRDFTVNALYADSDGTVHDLVGGLADIESKTIRFIGDASQRIAEDYLRILRFFRFFAHYGSGRPDADGLRACARGKAGLKQLSAERVWSELKKLLSAEDPGRALLWMRQSGVLTDILPETEKWGIDAVPGLVAAERALGWPVDPLLRLAAIVAPRAEIVTGLAERLKLSGVEARSLEDWAASLVIGETIADTAFDRNLYQAGASGIVMQLKLALASARAKAEMEPKAMQRAAFLQRLLSRAENWQRPVFPVTGKDLIEKGFSPGPEIGEILVRLEKRWLTLNFTPDKDQLLSVL